MSPDSVTPDAFFRPDAEQGGFTATPAAAGPWDPRLQHGGLAAALVSHAIDEHCGADGRRTVRCAFDILRPIPVGAVRVDVEVVRPGRTIELVRGRMLDAGGVEVMTGRAWRFLVADADLDDPDAAAPSPALPGADQPVPPFFPIAHDHGYHRSMQWRFTRGAWCTPGAALVWLRMTLPLVEGMPTSAWERVLAAADSASGASAGLDPRRHTFPNVDLAVTLDRDPVGEWIGLDAESRYSQLGSGRTRATVLDESGVAGHCTQTLLVGTRTPSHATQGEA